MAETQMRTPIFRIIDSNLNTGGKDCKREDAAINGKAKYARIFVKRIGWRELREDGLYECVFDNADAEDMEYIEKRINGNKIRL